MFKDSDSTQDNFNSGRENSQDKKLRNRYPGSTSKFSNYSNNSRPSFNRDSRDGRFNRPRPRSFGTGSFVKDPNRKSLSVEIKEILESFKLELLEEIKKLTSKTESLPEKE